MISESFDRAQPSQTQADARALVGVRHLLRLFRDALPTVTSALETSALELILKEIRTMSETFETEMERLRADVAAQGSVIASATAAFRGVVAQLVTAEAAAKSAGASDTQIASVAALRQSLENNTAMLANAIPANTPVVPTTMPQTPATLVEAPAAPVAPPAAAPADAPTSSSVAADAPAPAATA